MINSDSKVITMIVAYNLKLYLKIYCTNVRAQKINKSTFEIFEIVLASIQVENKLKKTCFFLEPFLLTDINIDVILEISFLNFSNTDIQFTEKKLTKKFYITTKTLPITK